MHGAVTPKTQNPPAAGAEACTGGGLWLGQRQGRAPSFPAPRGWQGRDDVLNIGQIVLDCGPVTPYI